MSGEERLKHIDPGTGLTLEELIDSFIRDPRKAKSLKEYIMKNACCCEAKKDET